LKHVSDNSESFPIEDVHVMLNLYLLLYADDTIILAEDANNLQCALNGLHNYCNDWKLSVNTKKTKVVIFSRGKIRNKPVFKLGDSKIDICDEYEYLGCIMNYNGKFKKAINERVLQGRRAMFSLLSKSNMLNLPLDITCQLFDTLVTPVLLYGCEVWGIENIHEIETVQVKFCKILLKLQKSTPNCMALGELGRHQLRTEVDKRMSSFWVKLVTGKQAKISCKLFQLAKSMYNAHVYEPKWLTHVKNVLDSCGYSYLWDINVFNEYNPKWLQSVIHLRLEDMAKQKWLAEVNSNSKCINYRIFKNKPGFENYLSLLHGKNAL
jgi:hypothetical protein